jgi:heat shock protein HslJ
MMLERTVLRALTGSFRVDVADRSLTLSSESGSAIRFAEAAQPKLEGVQWKVTGFNNGRQAVLSPRLGTTLSVGFENGAVRGNAGCNTFRGTYTVNGGRIAIRALAATRKLCREEGVMEQEREFLAALESTVRWTIERGMLDMRGADGARTLTATRNAR